LLEITVQNQPPEPARRETMLTVVLTGLLAAGFLLFLIMVSGGFFFYVVLAVAAITGLGFFHYVLWGRALTLEVAEEQAQATQRAGQRADPSNDGPSDEHISRSSP
jgi:hypothetical protein